MKLDHREELDARKAASPATRTFSGFQRLGLLTFAIWTIGVGVHAHVTWPEEHIFFQLARERDRGIPNADKFFNSFHEQALKEHLVEVGLLGIVVPIVVIALFFAGRWVVHGFREHD